MNEKKYKKKYLACLEDLKKDFKIVNKEVTNSYFDYLCKIGELHFTHENFAEALVSGENYPSKISRDKALKYIKEHKKNRYEHYKKLRYKDFKYHSESIFDNFNIR